MSEYEINNNNLDKAIIGVIAFFDLFDHPLTLFEVWTQLDRKWKITEVSDFLNKDAEGGAPVFGGMNGFYFLSGRQEIVMERQKRHNYSARKIRIARRFVRIFSIFPYVKMIALANCIGQYNLRDGSDIDLFIISSPRRIWLARLYCTGLAKALNCRPSANNKKDKICLSFYISSDHLCLDDLRLAGEDPYFDYWRRSLILLYNEDKIYERFLNSNKLLSKDMDEVKIMADRANILLDSLEILAKKLQLSIMPRELKLAMNNSDGVVINDSILKLYLRDRRREFAKKYGDKIDEIFKEDN